MVSKIFFFLATWWVGYFLQQCRNFFLLPLCCIQFFSSDKRLQEIFFQNHPPPPSRVKWSAPNWVQIIDYMYTRINRTTEFINYSTVFNGEGEGRDGCMLLK